jgi:hypothetical protein
MKEARARELAKEPDHSGHQDPEYDASDLLDDEHGEE